MVDHDGQRSAWNNWYNLISLITSCESVRSPEQTESWCTGNIPFCGSAAAVLIWNLNWNWNQDLIVVGTLTVRSLSRPFHIWKLKKVFLTDLELKNLEKEKRWQFPSVYLSSYSNTLRTKGWKSCKMMMAWI